MYVYVLYVSGDSKSARIVRGEFEYPGLYYPLLDRVRGSLPSWEGMHITLVLDYDGGHGICPRDFEAILRNVRGVAAEVSQKPPVHAVGVCAPANAIEAMGSVLDAHKSSLCSLVIKFPFNPTQSGSTPCATAAARLIAHVRSDWALEVLYVSLEGGTSMGDASAAALADALKALGTVGTHLREVSVCSWGRVTDTGAIPLVDAAVAVYTSVARVSIELFLFVSGLSDAVAHYTAARIRELPRTLSVPTTGTDTSPAPMATLHLDIDALLQPNADGLRALVASLRDYTREASHSISASIGLNLYGTNEESVLFRKGVHHGNAKILRGVLIRHALRHDLGETPHRVRLDVREGPRTCFTPMCRTALGIGVDAGGRASDSGNVSGSHSSSGRDSGVLWDNVKLEKVHWGPDGLYLVAAFLLDGRTTGLRSLDVHFFPWSGLLPDASEVSEPSASSLQRLHDAAVRLRDAVAGHRTLTSITIVNGAPPAGLAWSVPPPEFVRAVLDALRAPFCPLRTLILHVRRPFVEAPDSDPDAVRRAYLVDGTDENNLVPEAEVDMRARLGARLAFGLAFHPRCGRASPAHMLHENLVGAILELVPAHTGVSMWYS